jgi:hypothetical protein
MARELLLLHIFTLVDCHYFKPQQHGMQNYDLTILTISYIQIYGAVIAVKAKSIRAQMQQQNQLNRVVVIQPPLLVTTEAPLYSPPQASQEVH